MAIYINGRFLTKKLTGIQRYAMEVLKQLDNIETKEEIILLRPKNTIYEFDFKKIKIKTIGNLKGNLWEQITIPFYLLGKKNAKLISLFNSAPILFPSYIALHDIAFKTNPSHLTRSFIAWYSFMTRLNIKRYKHIFTVSEFSKKEICDTYKISPEKITVTYNSAEHLLEIPEDKKVLEKLNIQNKEFCFSLGSKSQHKNHKFIEECAKNNPSIMFVIAGGSNNRVLKYDESEKIDNLINTGYITDNELVSLYKNCKCFIFPSLYEGFGIPPLEAITCGCNKVLVSNLPVFKEVYGDSVDYINFEDDNKYDIKRVLYSNKQVDKKIIEKYSWKKIAEKILNVVVGGENAK